MSVVQYAPAVGSKFYPDGSIRAYPGNTIICFVNPASPVFQHCAWIQGKLRALPFANKFTLLPMSSMHMTVFQLITHESRVPEKWSKALPLDAPLEATDTFFIEKWSKIEKPAPFRMAYRTLQQGHSGVSIRLRPRDSETQVGLRAYRELLADVMRVRFPDHETYEFHISLAYRILNLTERETELMHVLIVEVNEYLQLHFGTFETDEPQLTLFDDMFAFVPADEQHLLNSRKRG